MSPNKYHLVAPDACDAEKNGIDQQRYQTSSHRKWASTLTLLILLVSLSSNVLLIYERTFQPWRSCDTLATQHAHLRNNVPRDMVPPPEYSSQNRTTQEAVWSDPRLKTADLFVALDESYIISKGVPHSQRWPWDSSKGVYIPLAAHEMHCIHTLRTHINEVQDGVPASKRSWSYVHILHCLNTLRETVMCNADDRLMYTGRLHANVHYEESLPGRGTIKMCRDWDQLVEWAHKHSACYAKVHLDDPSFPEFERYKFCPDKSRPWENAKGGSDNRS